MNLTNASFCVVKFKTMREDWKFNLANVLVCMIYEPAQNAGIKNRYIHFGP